MKESYGILPNWKRKASGDFEFLKGGKTYSARVYYVVAGRKWKISGFPHYEWDTAIEAMKFYELFYNATGQETGVSAK